MGMVLVRKYKRENEREKEKKKMMRKVGVNGGEKMNRNNNNK